LPGVADDPLELAAAGVRRLITLVVGRPIAEDELRWAAREVARVADRLEGLAAAGKRPRTLPDPDLPPQDIFPTSPVIGRANPLAPPVEVWADDSGVDPQLRGRVVFGYAYEGPPTCVHGGVIAEVFDELLGAALIHAGRPGMTGTLSVRYRRPTPLQSEVELMARPTTVDGRKLGVWGAMYHDGELTAEAEGIFIAVPPGRMLDIVNANAGKAGAEVVDERLRTFIDGGGEVLAAE
jgi:hypothetical protein